MSAHPRLDPSPGRPEASSAPPPAPRPPNEWRLPVFSGRLAELSGSHASATLTLAFRLVLESQREGEPVAWITGKQSTFYPPDAADAAVDLSSLVVVRTAEILPALRAADHLVRSGAFGLVVLDLGTAARVPSPAQARLMGLAKKHHTAVLCITEKDGDRPSLGSLVSIRAEASRARKVEDRFLCEVRVLKDKRHGPGWKHTEICHGPAGLC